MYYLFSDHSFQKLREKSGLNVDQVVDLTGKSQRTVYRWESGEVEPDKLVMNALNDIIKRKASEVIPSSYDFTFIDLFAGIGGIRHGFQGAGGKCVFTSEWNTFSQKTYRANFPDDHEITGDITQVDETDIPTHDVLLAGFPCQPFSIAGVSKKKSLGRAHGFLDKTQGTLFFDVARIIEHHKPVAFLLENVKNLVSHDKGNTFKVIKETLQKIGYTIDTKIIDGQGFVPQHRERIYIAGFFKDTGFKFDNLDIPDPKEGPKIGSIFHKAGDEPEEPYTDRKGKVNSKYTLSDKLWEFLQAYSAKHKAAGNGFGYGIVGPKDTSRTLSARYYKDGSEVLVKQRGKNPRRLTPRECARLMGFDYGKRKIAIPVSDTQAYRQFGNAVVVPVIEMIAKGMKPGIIALLEKRNKKTA